MFRGLLRSGLFILFAALLGSPLGLSSEITAPEPGDQELLSNNPLIYKLYSKQKNSRGYKLIYVVDVPLEIYWRFKTDFDNEFLLTNKFINTHRLISRKRNVIVTENQYSTKPKAVFRWQTTVLKDQYLLKFTLLNPQECGQEYHYGYIQVEALGTRTKVTQVAHFDFFGVSLWINYPYYGGMRHFLKYTATWEQETVLTLKDKYGSP